MKEAAHKTYTVKEATVKLMQYCAYRDRTHKEVEEKLRSLNMIPEAQEQIIMELMQENFLNEERFAKSFARGKFRIKKWGKKRITNELKLRGISARNIQTGLKELSETDYLKTFHEISEKKWDNIKETSAIKKKKKLVDYLQYRGWESHLIFEKANELSKQND
ncbi:regulatory protein RecX [Zunongwangia endophytica]|uniref:Regulatory protein RecX n=1 Tax=Zunongwangia endophytica TaxID=1808945 RepID=A0ABV8H4X3_9FLAO|nr:regulatory protein RecX [Zunongwangia endophytica]MDN3595633.1 regulatory protein RecX [Zunongwangia endophytica]